jgi:hypothetical protein
MDKRNRCISTREQHAQNISPHIPPHNIHIHRYKKGPQFTYKITSSTCICLSNRSKSFQKMGLFCWLTLLRWFGPSSGCDFS